MPWTKYNPDYQLGGYPPSTSPKVTSECVKVTGGTTEDSVNTPVDITALRSGAIVKIPVVLAELTIKINVDAVIDLPEPAFEIKRIKKRVKVTQCLLLQDTNVLCIEGFIRKNIEYATRKCSNEEGFCGDIRHCTVDVPFTCTTPVDFNGIAPIPPVKNTASEFEYFKREAVSGPGFTEKHELQSGDLREFNQISTEFFNELPFCELVSARIVEFDEAINPVCPHKVKIPFEEKEFKSIREKMVIFLTLKVLQKRQVAVPPTAISPINDC